MVQYGMRYFKPLTISLLVISVLTTGCKDKGTAEQKKKEEAMEEFERSAKEMQANTKREFNSEEGLTSNPESLNRMIDASKKLEDATSGDDAKLAKVMRLFMESIQNDMKEFAKHETGLQEGIDYGKITSPDQIDQLSEKVKSYQKANKTLQKKIKTEWLQRVRENLKKEDIGKEYSEGFMQGMEKKYKLQYPHLMKIRSADNQLCDAVLTQHAILKKYWGKWQWNAEHETPDFEDQKALDAYNKEALRIQKAAEEQHKAQQEVIKIQ